MLAYACITRLSVHGEGSALATFTSSTPTTIMKRCPACGLPFARAMPGDAVAASSDDNRRHVVAAICRRCAASAQSLPPRVYRKLLTRAADRALGDPDRYLCMLAADAGAARLTIGLLGHPAHAVDTLNALGWGDGINHPE